MRQAIKGQSNTRRKGQASLSLYPIGSEEAVVDLLKVPPSLRYGWEGVGGWKVLDWICSRAERAAAPSILPLPS